MSRQEPHHSTANMDPERKSRGRREREPKHGVVSVTRPGPVAGTAVALFLLATLLPRGASAATTGADPSRSGPHDTDVLEYDAQFAAPRDVGSGDVRPPTRLRGVIHVPSDERGPLPVVVFLHGAHEPCRLAGEHDVSLAGLVWPPCPGPAGLAEETPSWRGYDYLASNLASHGYLVMAVDSNWTMAFRPPPLNDIPDRADVLHRSLDLLRAWHERSRISDDGIGASLAGRVDFERIGLVGHSRGADAIGHFLEEQISRPPTERYDGVVAAVQIAAVAVGGPQATNAPSGVHLATVVGSCDADTGSRGVALWDRGRFLPSASPYARAQFQIMGANHAFFNSQWYDEWEPAATYPFPLNRPVNTACTAEEPTSRRLARADQERIAGSVVGAFLRRYVGDEPQFQGLVAGEVSLPSSACPVARHGNGRPLACAEVLRAAYLAPGADRRMLLPTDAAGGGDGAISVAGDVDVTSCDPSAGVACPEPANDSIAAQLTLQWDGPGVVTVSPPSPIDASAHTALTFRAAINPSDERNAAVDAQRFDVCLVDAHGTRSCVDAGGRSPALVRAPAGDGTRYESADPERRGQRSLVLSGVPIDLDEFDGIDVERISHIELRVGRDSATGSVQLADLAFQTTS